MEHGGYECQEECDFYECPPPEEEPIEEDPIKDLFNLVYTWGKAGVKTDHNCNVYQGLIKKIIGGNKMEHLEIEKGLRELPPKIVSAIEVVSTVTNLLALSELKLERLRAKVYLEAKEKNPKATVKDLDAMLICDDIVFETEEMLLKIKADLIVAKGNLEGLQTEFTAIRKQESLFEALRQIAGRE